MPNSMTTALGTTTSSASSTSLAGECGALETGIDAQQPAYAAASSGAARGAAQDAAQDAELHDVPEQATSVAEVVARDGSDAIGLEQCTLTSLVARMVDYAGLGGPPCSDAVFGQLVPLSGSDLRRPPRGPHPTRRAWQQGIGKDCQRHSRRVRWLQRSGAMVKCQGTGSAARRPCCLTGGRVWPVRRGSGWWQAPAATVCHPPG